MNAGMLESKQHEVTVQLSNLADVPAFERLLRILYTEAAPAKGSVEELLPVVRLADQFQVHAVVDILAQHLFSLHLNVEDAEKCLQC